MIIAIAVGAISVLFSWLARFKNTQFGLWVSFASIFLFLALRYNFGNDYQAYLDRFIEINSYSGFNILDKTINQELGWILLCRIFKPIGFFGMTAVIAAFNCFVYFQFIKRYVPIRYYWLAVFLYVFSPGFMLIHSSAMRQSLAINLFLLSLPYLIKKKALGYFLFIGLASLFHFSALILAPVYLIGLFNFRIKISAGIALLSIFIFLFIYGKIFLPYIERIVSEKIVSYEVYVHSGGAELTTGLGVLFLALLLLLTVYYDRFQQGDRALLFKLNILNLMFVPLGLIIMMLGRIGMYFAPASIAVLPIIVSTSRNRLTKIAVSTALICFTLYGFYQFFQSPIWRDAFMTYHTIFSAPEIY